jgi:ribosomal protein S12 methylthiotransferase accessory factor
MIHKPRFKRQYRVEVRSAELVLLFWEHGVRSIKGRLHPLLAPLIDGNRTAAEIAELLSGQATGLDVAFGLSLLAEDGYIEEGDQEPAWLGYFNERRGVSNREARERLDRSQVSLLALDDIDCAPIAAALGAMGVPVSHQGTHEVVLVNDYLRPELDGVSRSRSVAKRPWLLAKPVGTVHWLGPVFDGTQGPCWNCLALRLTEIRAAQYSVCAGSGADGLRPPGPEPPQAFPATTQLLAMEIFRWVVESGGLRELITLDYSSGAQERHVVVSRQNCPQCGREEAPSRRMRPELKSRYKASPLEGGYRVESPDEVIARYARHLSPVTGIVSRLEPYGPEREGIAPSYIAEHLFAPRTAGPAGPQLRRSAGKGITRTHAKASALCEALERYSGVFRGDEPCRLASFEEMDGLAVHPETCLNFSQRQYREREKWNRMGHAVSRVPAPFDTKRPVQWSPAWSLTEKRFKYVASAYCYYGCPLPQDHLFCRADSNGCAAGSCMEEAI